MNNKFYGKQKPFPPGGEYLARLLLNGCNQESTIVCIGYLSKENIKKWDLFPTTMYLPFGHSPLRYNWPLRNVDVYIMDSGYSTYSPKSSRQFIKFCATVFYAYGARNVKSFNQNKIIEFNKDINK